MNFKLIALAIMDYSNQHIVFDTATRVYISILTLVLTVLVLAILYVGRTIHRLNIVVEKWSERSEMGDRVQARRTEGKKEYSNRKERRTSHKGGDNSQQHRSSNYAMPRSAYERRDFYL
jgi:hypothetical protein